MSPVAWSLLFIYGGVGLYLLLLWLLPDILDAIEARHRIDREDP